MLHWHRSRHNMAHHEFTNSVLIFQWHESGDHDPRFLCPRVFGLIIVYAIRDMFLRLVVIETMSTFRDLNLNECSTDPNRTSE